MVSGRVLFVLPEPPAVRTFGVPDGRVGSSLDVLVWNVHKGVEPAWGPAFDSLAARADLVLLQEVDDSAMLAELDDVPGMQWTLGTAWERRWSGLGSGPAVGSRLPVRAQLHRTDSRELGVWTPKAYVAARLGWDGADLLAITVHGLNLVSAADYQAQLHDIEATIERHAGPVLLAGDFNCWVRGRREAVQQLVRRTGLEAVVIEGDARAKPWRVSVDPDDPWARALGVSPLVDLAFARGVTATGGEAYPVPDPGAGRVRASDHAALRFRLRRAP